MKKDAATPVMDLEYTMRALRLVGISEIAEELGVTRQAVTNWRARDHTFPKPLAELRMGPVWRLGPILRWARETQSGRRLYAERTQSVLRGK